MDTISNPTLTPTSVLLAMLRRTKGRAPGSKSICGVCGKENSRSDAKVDAKCPIHKEAHEGKDGVSYVELVAKLDQLLNRDSTSIDMRKNFNAQIDWYSQRLLLARQEHEAYVPDVKEPGAVKAGVTLPAPKYADSDVAAALREILGMLGGKAENEPHPLKLAEYVKSNLRLLLADRK
jgi:hypothetical protein